MDKSIIFYDTKEKKDIKVIETAIPLGSIGFCCDGHSIAVGGSTSGQVLLYDLRKSKTPLRIIDSHKHAVTNLQFTFKESMSRHAPGSNVSRILNNTREEEKIPSEPSISAESKMAAGNGKSFSSEASSDAAY